MSGESIVDEAQVLTNIIAALKPLSNEARARLMETVATFYEMPSPARTTATLAPVSATTAPTRGEFSDDRSASPKEFLHQKDPEGETARLVCLAYYLTHYRATPHFGTLDITQLNTEAAQIKLSNASATLHSAIRQGLIGPAPGGQKQITARGERFVSLLPNREEARAILGDKRASRKRRSNVK